jgi:hypothetical protein
MARRKRRRPVHTARFDKCVKDVKRTGSAENPYAVCEASLGEKRAVLKRSRRRRARRENPRVFVIRAQRADHPVLTYTGTKFERGGTPVKFPTKALADTWVRHLRRDYSEPLRKHRLRVVPL